MSVLTRGHVPYTEDYQAGTYTFQVRCGCGSITPVTLDGGDLWHHRQGANVQSAFPDLPASKRETLISGLCPACQRAFGWDA